MQPLLRWAGSKKRQFSAYKSYFPLDFGRYIEPFAGSAAFAFRMDPKEILLNDINHDLIEFYRHASVDPTYIYGVFESINRSKEEYYNIRNIFNEIVDSKERSAMFYYLNRNCFNGIYRVNQKGKFNVPFSENRVSPYLTLEQFIESSRVISKARLTNGDFEEFCRDNVKSGDFLFIDPPYYSVNQRIFNEYTSRAFDPTDFERLEDTLRYVDRRGGYFLLSFPSGPVTSKLQATWRGTSLDVRRTVASSPANRNIQSETLISNY